MRRLACNWPWLSNTTRIVVASEDHFSGSCIIALSYSTERMVAPGDWHWPHRFKTNRTCHIYIYCCCFFIYTGNCNISWSYLCYGSCVTIVALNNEAPWDSGDTVTFFILVWSRKSFRTSELCSRCYNVY